MIATLREDAGMTQSALARQIGLTQGALSNLERGRRRPAARTLAAICAALSLSDADTAALLRFYNAKRGEE